MRLHRFIGEFDLDAQRISHRDAGLASQLKNVLRLEPGDEVELCDGRGRDARARIAALGASTAEFDVLETRPNLNEPRLKTVLYCALLKKENFDFVLQKATEAGASRIIPIRTARTVKLELRPDRAAKIVREAAEQSGRGIVPDVSAPLGLEAALDDAAGNAANVMFELGGTPFDAAAFKEVPSVGAFIGPEGGWEQREVSAASDLGIRIMSLGPRTYRAETAAIIAAHLIASL